MHLNGVAHLDLSLENTMIETQRNLHVKIIDFGVAKKRIFNQKEWKLNVRVGKMGYMAPEVYDKKLFDPRKADLWSLGVMLYIMILGTPPYTKPNKRDDQIFRYIMKGHIKDLLKHQKRLRLVTDDILLLFESIFKREKDRINMDNLLDSKFVGLNQWRLKYIKQNSNNINNGNNIDNNIHTNNDRQKPVIINVSNDDETKN